MFVEPDNGVIIMNGRSGIRLVPDGAPNELGFPTLIEVRAGPFAGSVRDQTVGLYPDFRQKLVELYDNLSGNAQLGSYEGFSLILSGNGHGAIHVSIKVIGEHVPSIRLTYEFQIDQTYLPTIIRQVEQEFLGEDLKTS
jgi:hypothetical protein